MAIFYTMYCKHTAQRQGKPSNAPRMPHITCDAGQTIAHINHATSGPSFSTFIDHGSRSDANISTGPTVFLFCQRCTLNEEISQR